MLVNQRHGLGDMKVAFEKIVETLGRKDANHGMVDPLRRLGPGRLALAHGEQQIAGKEESHHLALAALLQAVGDRMAVEQDVGLPHRIADPEDRLAIAIVAGANAMRFDSAHRRVRSGREGRERAQRAIEAALRRCPRRHAKFDIEASRGMADCRTPV